MTVSSFVLWRLLGTYISPIETGLYYLQSRYYNPEIGRFINADSLVSTGQGILGYNMFAYCNNNPVNNFDPSGNFAITTAMILAAIGVGAAIGAGVGFGASVVEDLENGKLFDGDKTFLSYLGNTLGGGIGGAGLGLCSVLGAGLGVALSTGTALTIGGTAISGGIAFTTGVSGAFVSGGLGYAVRAGISDQEKFEWSDMFIDAGANAISGMLTFTGAMAGGITGVKVPGAKFSFKNFGLYHLGATYFGVYPSKFMFSTIKKNLKERY